MTPPVRHFSPSLCLLPPSACLPHLAPSPPPPLAPPLLLLLISSLLLFLISPLFHVVSPHRRFPSSSFPLIIVSPLLCIAFSLLLLVVISPPHSAFLHPPAPLARSLRSNRCARPPIVALPSFLLIDSLALCRPFSSSFSTLLLLLLDPPSPRRLSSSSSATLLVLLIDLAPFLSSWVRLSSWV